MAFQGSDPMIYATQQIDGQNRKWHETDIYRKLAKISALGFRWNPETNTLVHDGKPQVGIQTPWVHARGDWKYRCGFDHHILFNQFNVIAPSCLNCWKVCMGLPTFKDLMLMEEIQRQLPDDCPCKCGIEVRDYTPKEYGAYFYTRSLEEGRERYEQIKDIVTKNFDNGKEIADGIVLKRGCTEFEMVQGPSNYWHLTPQQAELYEFIDAHVVDRRGHVNQQESIKRYVKQNWILWAHSHGDFTYLPWNGGKKLFPDYVTYHTGDIDKIHADIKASIDSLYEKPRPTEEEVDLSTVEEFSKEVIGEQDELT
jgi:hypothetical protein